MKSLTPCGKVTSVPLFDLDSAVVEEYWQALIAAGTLKYRFCNCENPDWQTVLHTIVACGNNMYCEVDEDGKVVAEFLIEHFTGASAQIHFSMHPDLLTRYALTIAREASGQIMITRKLKSLFGLTPLPNRAACIFIQKVGFKKVGILPGGLTYLGTTVDALITVKELGHGK